MRDPSLPAPEKSKLEEILDLCADYERQIEEEQRDALQQRTAFRMTPPDQQEVVCRSAYATSLQQSADMSRSAYVTSNEPRFFSSESADMSQSAYQTSTESQFAHPESIDLSRSAQLASNETDDQDGGRSSYLTSVSLQVMQSPQLVRSANPSGQAPYPYSPVSTPVLGSPNGTLQMSSPSQTLTPNR